MQEREDERLCREAYEHHLRDVLGINGFSITEGDEPPDYWLSLDGKRYGVEVTTIFKKVEGGEKTIEIIGYQRSIHDLTGAIEEEAKKQNTLTGKYYVNFHGMPKYSPNRHKRAIVKSAIEYISKTQSQENTEPLVLHTSSGGRIAILKTANDHTYVSPGLMGSRAGWQGESVQEVLDLSESTLKKKADKLSTLQNICDGLILLILNRYQMFRESDWELLFEYWDSQGAEFFHSIYYIQGKGEVIPVKEGAL